MQLDPQASLGALATLISDVSKGEYDDGGLAAFRRALTNPGVFAQA